MRIKSIKAYRLLTVNNHIEVTCKLIQYDSKETLCFCFFCSSEFHGKADSQANTNVFCLRIGLAVKL